MDATDQVLLERWQRQRDADAFTELVQRYSGLVYSCCRRMLGSAAEAEDAAQECFVALLQSRGRIRTSVAAWLHTVAVRRCIDRIRADARRRRRESAFAEGESGAAPARDAALDELIEHVDAAIAGLPEPFHAAVVARFIEGKSHADMARTLGTAESTVRYRVEQGVERIRGRLRRQGVTLAGAGALAGVLGQSAGAAPAGLVARAGKLAVSGAVGAVPGLALPPLAIKLVLGGVLVLAAFTAWHWQRQASERAAGLNGAVQPAAPAADADASAAAPPPVPQAAAVPAAAPSTTVEPAGDEPFAIRGRVYDAVTGAGIAGAKARVTPEGGGLYLGESEPTGPDGTYTIPPLEDGAYSVSLEPIEGYPDPRRSRRASVTLADGQPMTGVDFALEPGIAVSGVVQTADGAPAARVDVGLVTPAAPNPEMATTGTDGRFTVYLPGPTRGAMVQGRTENWETPAYDDLTIPESGRDDLVLLLDQPKTASVSGVLADFEGQPVADARIHLYRKSACVFRTGNDATSSADGRFQATGLGPGEYAVIVTPKSANGFSTAEEYARVTLAPGQAVEGLRVLYGDLGGHAIAGKVLDSLGKPVGGATLNIYGQRHIRAYSEADGRFMITGLEDKTYSVAAGHYDYSGTTVQLAAGTLDAVITLEDPAQLRVRVVAADTGLPLTAFSVGQVGGRVQVLDEMLYGSLKPVESPDGTFSAGKVRAGEVSVIAAAPGYAAAWRVITAQPGAVNETEFRLQPAEPVEGVVVDAAGQPVADAFVYFVEHTAFDRMDRAAAAKTGGGGRFRIEGLPGDREWLAAYKPGHGVGVSQLSHVDRIVLPEPATYSGRIEPGGVSMSDMIVNYRYPDAPHAPHGYTRPNSDGRFQLADLPPGALTVSVYPNGSEPYAIERTVTVNEGGAYEGEFVFEPTGAAAVAGVLTSGGAPVAQAFLTLERRLPDRVERMRGRVDEAGRYRFEGVWAGDLVLVIKEVTDGIGYETETYEVPIAVPAGGEVVRDIALER